MKPMCEDFTRSLKDLEESKDSGKITELFGDQGEVASLAHHAIHGRQQIERFWREYLGAFQEVKTEFVRTIESGRTAVLEWVSSGKLQNGRDFRYEGVTVLDFDREGKIASMKAYYDSAAFLERAPSEPRETSESRERGFGLNQQGLTTTHEIMEGGGRKEEATPGEGILTNNDAGAG